MNRAFVLVLSLVLIGGCSKRERLNPFDPGNPSTRGRPLGFEAVAGDGIVTLRWTPVSANGLVGFRAYRRVATETTYQPISSLLPTGADRFQDVGLANGVEHLYRLYYAFTDGLGGEPAEDAAIPGSLRPWFTDFSLARLIRISPDGRHVATQRRRSAAPTRSRSTSATAWSGSATTSPRWVVIFNPSNGLRFEIRAFSSPDAVAIDPRDGTAWIADSDQNTVRHFTENNTTASPADLGPVIDPIAVAVDPRDGAVWACEYSGDHVRRFTADGAPDWAQPMTRPSRVDVDSVTGNGWVTSVPAGHRAALQPHRRAGSAARRLRGTDRRRGRSAARPRLGGRRVRGPGGGANAHRPARVHRERPLPGSARSRSTGRPARPGSRFPARVWWRGSTPPARCAGGSAASRSPTRSRSIRACGCSRSPDARSCSRA